MARRHGSHAVREFHVRTARETYTDFVHTPLVHPERIPSATSRYADEILRVMGVIELGLERNGTGWLVGNKSTYADLSFRTWAAVGEGLLREIGRFEGVKVKYPRYTKWLGAMDEMQGVKRIQEKMATGRKEHGLD